MQANDANNKWDERGRVLSVALAWFVLVEAILIMLGWWFEMHFWVQVKSDWSPTPFNTALALALAACAVLAEHRGRHTMSRLCLSLVVGLSLVSLAQYALGVKLGIDELFVRPYIRTDTPFPGRMAPNACFCLLALSLAEFIRLPASRVRLAPAGVLPGMVAALSLTTLLGYALGLPVNIGFRDLTVMAMPAALGLLALSVGSLSAALRVHSRAFPGVRNPWLPVTVGMFFALASLVLWSSLLGQHEYGLANRARLSARLMERDVNLAIERGFLALVEPTAPDFARELFEEGPTVQPPPLEAARVQDFGSSTRRLFCATERGQLWLAIRKAREISWGRLDLRASVRSALGSAPGLGYEILVDDCVVLARGEQPGFFSKTLRGELGGSVMNIRVWSTSSAHTTSSAIVVILGLLLAVSASFMVAEGQSAHARKDELEAWVEGAPLGLFLVNPRGQIMRANHRACEVLGAKRTEVEGTAVESWMPRADEEQQQAWRGALGRTLAPQLVGSRGYVEFERRDGGRVPVELGIGPVSIAGQRYYLCAATNIEERLRTSAALERGAQELAAANEELRRYSSALSHDLRAPIRGMLLLANFIQEDDGDQLSEPSRDHLALLRRRGGMALRMVEGLLDLARMDRGSQERERLDLAQLVEEAFELVGAPPTFQLKIHFSSIELSVVRAALLQVIFNLLSNAVGHHQTPGGVIQVHARVRDGWATIAIEDDGPGIPDAQKDEAFGVFRRFAEPSPPRGSTHHDAERSSGESGPQPGIGLGLALVKKRVELVGGMVQLSDSPDGGLMVEFTWPSA